MKSRNCEKIRQIERNVNVNNLCDFTSFLKIRKNVVKSHYYKSQIFVQNSILTKPQHFHELFIQNFFDNFSRKIKVVNSYKVQNHNIFTSFSPKKLTIFTKNKVDFLDKKGRFRKV